MFTFRLNTFEYLRQKSAEASAGAIWAIFGAKMQTFIEKDIFGDFQTLCT